MSEGFFSFVLNSRSGSLARPYLLITLSLYSIQTLGVVDAGLSQVTSVNYLGLSKNIQEIYLQVSTVCVIFNKKTFGQHTDYYGRKQLTGLLKSCI